jgi:hypothetical protein
MLVLAGTALQYLSLLMILRANAETLVPYWTGADRTPKGSIPLRAASAGILVLGCALLTPSLGYGVVFVLLAVLLPGVPAIVVHNRRVAARA